MGRYRRVFWAKHQHHGSVLHSAVQTRQMAIKSQQPVVQLVFYRVISLRLYNVLVQKKCDRWSLSMVLCNVACCNKGWPKDKPASPGLFPDLHAITHPPTHPHNTPTHTRARTHTHQSLDLFILRTWLFQLPGDHTTHAAYCGSGN